jgi:hypothetical protein
LHLRSAVTKLGFINLRTHLLSTTQIIFSSSRDYLYYLARTTSNINMFIPILPLYQTALLSSVSMTSFTLFSNVAGRNMGIIPLINQKYEPFPIGPQQKVKAWNSHFSRAMVSTPFTPLLFLFAPPHQLLVLGDHVPMYPNPELTISSGALAFQ